MVDIVDVDFYSVPFSSHLKYNTEPIVEDILLRLKKTNSTCYRVPWVTYKMSHMSNIVVLGYLLQ